jgi:hypothetical protein
MRVVLWTHGYFNPHEHPLSCFFSINQFSQFNSISISSFWFRCPDWPISKYSVAVTLLIKYYGFLLKWRLICCASQSLQPWREFWSMFLRYWYCDTAKSQVLSQRGKPALHGKTATERDVGIWNRNTVLNTIISLALNNLQLVISKFIWYYFV